MCMFNDTPAPGKEHIEEPMTAWKVFALDEDGNLNSPIVRRGPHTPGVWQTATLSSYNNEGGWSVWRSWLGAWFYKHSIDLDNLVIRKVQVKGKVYGVGVEFLAVFFFCRGLRVRQMLIGSLKTTEDLPVESQEEGATA